jgi:uncharacterized protein YndB with AHSA1/START domain
LLKLLHLVALLVVCFACLSARSDDKPPEAKKTELDPTLVKLSQLIGGVWTNDNPKFVIEFRYEWAFNKTAIRGRGTIDRGGPNETEIEATFGWDPGKKAVYYLDSHGGSEIYYGTVKSKGDELQLEFTSLVGSPSKWRSVANFPDKDTYAFTIFGEKAGKWEPIVKSSLKRKQPPADAGSQVTEGVVEAPIADVWAAFATNKGQEAWNVAHAEIDLKVGGKMRTHYDPKGKIGDPNTIENIILSFEPKRMLSMKVGTPPGKFPFKEAIKSVWHVISFEAVGPKQTRVRVVGLGYGDDEASKKLRAFFEQGNAQTLKKLQEHFAAKKPKN